MTTITSARSAATHRPPATVVVASVLLGLIAAIGGYGAIYFTGLEGWNGIGLSFVVAYEFLAVGGLIAAIAFLRGHRLGRPAAIAYAIWMIYFTAFKLIAFQELQAIPFGVIAIIALICATRPTSR
ncbi:hypothetical protein E0H75_02715 [Kribbella capetownensis]|uniref:Uncharacterized protein n=1 Tax=Kribbella capetownensis TaxID=1572659 RepID=A0A4R0K0Z2_9ACTN|nr:hypothetical protein [Kribbella capetownensis]TCC52687.1 hypothetical protein E0H75_02715 [Kribbella capetownensis]